MGTLLDAYALIALLGKESAEPEVKRILRQGGARMPSVNLAEALDFLERRGGIGQDELRLLIEQLPLQVLPLTEPIGWRAAALRAKYYRRRDRAVSIADCALVATAEPGDAIATNDAPVLEMARAEGLKVVEL